MRTVWLIVLLLFALPCHSATITLRDNLAAPVADVGASLATASPGIVVEPPVPVVLSELSVIVSARLEDGTWFPAEAAEGFGYLLALAIGDRELLPLEYSSTLLEAGPPAKIRLDMDITELALVVPASRQTLGLVQLPHSGRVVGRVYHLASTLPGDDVYEHHDLAPLVTGGQWAARLVAEDGDLTGDGRIDGRDLLAWQRTPDVPLEVVTGGYGWGEGSGFGVQGAGARRQEPVDAMIAAGDLPLTPEPATWMLALFSLLVLVVIRRANPRIPLTPDS